MTSKYHVDLSDLPEDAQFEFRTQPPDLPLVRTSERKDFKRCPFLWHESWVRGLSSKRTPTWSWFGTAIHKGLEERYKVGAKRGKRKAVLEAFEEALDGETRRIWTTEADASDFDGEAFQQEIVDGKELGFAMLNGYIDHYGPEKDIYVVHSEQSFQIDVPDPMDSEKTVCVYAGTWDAIWYVDGIYWIVDHKTRKSFPANMDFYTIDDQAGSYLWVAPEVLLHMGVLSKKEVKKILGLKFNLLRKHMPDERPRNSDGLATNNPKREHYIEALAPVMDLPAKLPTLAVLEGYAKERGIRVLGDVSARQPAALFHRETVERSLRERVTQGQRVQSETKMMQMMRSGELPIIKTPTEDCVRCQLFDYCQADEHDPAEAWEIAQATLRNRDPYVDHRAMMERNGVEIKRK